jgi:hypothetical protein
MLEKISKLSSAAVATSPLSLIRDCRFSFLSVIEMIQEKCPLLLGCCCNFHIQSSYFICKLRNVICAC